jgi:hypothetical protein
MNDDRPKLTQERFGQMPKEEQQALIERELQRRDRLKHEPQVHVSEPGTQTRVREPEPEVHVQSDQQQQQQQQQQQNRADAWEALKEYRPRIKGKKEQGR